MWYICAFDEASNTDFLKNQNQKREMIAMEENIKNYWLEIIHYLIFEKKKTGQ